MGTKYNEGETAGGGGGDATSAKQTTILTGEGVSAAGVHTFGHNDHEILGRLDGFHNAIHILFVIPEAIASINTHNTVIKSSLETLGRCDTITQADALSYPHFREYRLIVLGTNNGTAWTTSNLADIKTIDVPVIAVDAIAASYLGMGTNGGDAAAKTAINAITNIEGAVLGIGRHGFTGLAAGANTVSASTTYSTLDMSNANITETWYAYESVNANTDVVLGLIYAEQVSGEASVDVSGGDIPATRGFYGAAYSMNDLNALGQGVLSILADTIFHETKTSRNGVASLRQKIFGDMTGSFTRTAPLVEYIAGQNSIGGKCAVGDSLSDMVNRNVSMMEFWSDVGAKVTLTTSSTNIPLPNITIADIPSGATIIRVVGMIRMRALNNTSASVNAINEALDAVIKVEKMGGTWTSLINIINDTWSVAASTKEGGMLIEGSADASAEVDANADYEFRFDGNCRVDGNNLDLVDVAVGMKVYFVA